MNFQILPPPSFERKVCHFNRTNIPLIRRAVTNFPLYDHLNPNPDPNWQAMSFTEILLNIISNFIPNELIRVKPRETTWIKQTRKNMLNKQSRLFEKHGYKREVKARLNSCHDECNKDILKATII